MTTDKHNKRPNVPPLRFPEFTEPWETAKLGDMTVNFSKRNKDEIEYPMYSVTNNRGFIPQSEQFEDREMVSSDIKSYKIITKGDFAYNPARINVGSIAKYNGDNDCMISSLYVAFRAKEQINAEWLMQLLKTPKMNFYYNLNAEGGVRMYLFYPNFERIRTSYPSLNEQRKVAQFLDLLDHRIAVQSGLINKLESLISGITLSIVKSNNCESIHLSELLTERNEVNTAQYEVYSVSVSQGVVNQVDYLGRSFAAKDTSNYNVVHYGDIVYTKSPTGDFPYGIVKRSGQTDPVAVSPLYGVYKPASNEIGCFLHYYFCNPVSAKNYLHKLIQKGAKNTINITNQRFLENTIKLPNTERLAIVVKLLNQLSVKKQRAEELLALYRKQKQYLLSQMFI